MTKNEKSTQFKKRRIIDRICNGFTYVFSSFGAIILVAIILYIFINGAPRLSWGLLTTDYAETTLTVRRDDSENFTLGSFNDPNIDGCYFSSVWGIGLEDAYSVSGDPIIKISYLDQKSPLFNVIDSSSKNYVELKVGTIIDKIVLTNENDDYLFALTKDGAEKMINEINKGTIVTDMITKTAGGGIRGSLIATFYLIILTLVIALVFGVGAAIYLNEYAPDNKITRALRYLIDLIGGIPSIIFGLLGMFVFIPMCNTMFSTNGGTIISGAFTLAVMLLPIIIKNIEEVLLVIPSSYRSASLALGASKTQTTFKVVLPNAIGGILTATLLSIGRIIGESAALMFAIGTTIRDDVAITKNGTSLAVHIWTLMQGDNPNFETSCAIAIVILAVVFTLNITIKIIATKLNKFGGK